MAARNPTPFGEKFNYLTVLGDAPNRPGNANRRIYAKCVCGKEKDYVLSEVRLGKTKSCGCKAAELSNNHTHGHTRAGKVSPEYHSWASMMTRCRNPKSQKYADYGGRGIQVCDRWNSFENFLHDMGLRPKGTTLERLRVNENYEPGNCIWGTQRQQSNNRRDNTFLEYAGKRQTISEWAEETGLAYNTIIARIHRLKWGAEKALTTPPRPSRQR